MNPLGIILTLIMVGMVVASSRRVAALGILASICYITQGQMIILGGFHFTSIRIVLLASLIRSWAKGETRDHYPSLIDKHVVWFVTVSAVFHIVREASSESLVGEFGIVYNILLSYFAFRYLLPRLEDVQIFLADAAFFIIPFALLMDLEALNGRNFFNMFGGVNSMDEFRDGHYRCSAAFRSPITAGSFGATFMPLFVGLFWSTNRRKGALVGIVSTAMITLASRSSGPAIEYIMIILALVFWRWRQHTQLARRAIVVALVGLHLVMKAPVWFLMGRISDLVGGGGWHRAEIVDAAVNHFRGWWFAGTNATGDWMATQLMDGKSDLTNQFVAEGVNSGLLALVLFIWLFVRGFKDIGLAMDLTAEPDSKTTKMLWALGASLVGTLVNFFSVSYFDQLQTVWYLSLALIASVTSDVLQRDYREEEDVHTVDPANLVQERGFGIFARPDGMPQF